MRDRDKRGAGCRARGDGDDAGESPGKRTLVGTIYASVRPTGDLISEPVEQRGTDDASYRDDLAFDLSGSSASATPRSEQSAGGRPIPAAARGSLERAAGTDLEGVRLHTGAGANALATSHDARAVTIGQDIHFADGELDEGGSDGKHLLAHEVAHTVQQRSGRATPSAKPMSATVPSDPAEIEADHFADAFVAGRAQVPIREGLGDIAALKRRDGGGTPSNVDVNRGPADISVQPQSLVFPDTAIGEVAEHQPVTITNHGIELVQIQDVAESIGGDKGAFLVATSGSLSEGIPAGESIDLLFGFRPREAGRVAATFDVITDGGAISARVQLAGIAFSRETNEVPTVAFSPQRLRLPATEVGKTSPTRDLVLSNRGHQPVTIEALEIQPSGSGAERASADEFTIHGSSGEALQPGETATYQVDHRPETEGTRNARVVAKANSGAIAGKATIAGQGLPSREKSQSELVADEGEDRYRDAWLRNEVSPTNTYAEMLSALVAAQRFTEQGDQASYQHAQKLVEAVNDRLQGLAPTMPGILRAYGVASLAGTSMFGHAYGEVVLWSRKLRLNATINADPMLTAFQAAEEEIKLGTGEAREAPNLRSFQSAGNVTARVVLYGGAALGAAALIPLLGELAPLLIEEAELLWASAKWIYGSLGGWALANPESATVLAELLAGLGITIGEGGWDAFAAQFESAEGLVYFLMQLAMDAKQLDDATSGGGGARRRTATSTDAPEPAARQPAASGANAGARQPRSTDAVAGGEAQPSAAATQARDQAVTRAQQAVGAIENAVGPSGTSKGAGADSEVGAGRVVLAGEDARINEAFSWLPPQKGTLDVVSHGTVDGFLVKINGAQVELDHRSIALLIKKSGLKYERIRLVACKTGMHPKGVAQHLANKLGVDVVAPTDLLWVNDDGTYAIGPKQNRNTGHWETFSPKKSELRYQPTRDTTDTSRGSHPSGADETDLSLEKAPDSPTHSELASSGNVVEPAAPDAPTGTRPTWQESERRVSEDLDWADFTDQRSFVDGEDVPRGTKGSTRPDNYSSTFQLSIDVKNYRIDNRAGRDRLVHDILEQMTGRAAHLPAGTRQGVVIDARGQAVRPEHLDAIRERLVRRGNLNVDDIVFLTE